MSRNNKGIKEIKRYIKTVIVRCVDNKSNRKINVLWQGRKHYLHKLKILFVLD